MKQCAVMFINPVFGTTPHPAAMRNMGFVVHEVMEWPLDEAAMRDCHVVIVAVKDMAAAPMLAARLRAKPHVDRRLVIALVPPSASAVERRTAEASGFDEVVNADCDSRHLTTRILRRLRAHRDLKCVLPPMPRQPAA